MLDGAQLVAFVPTSDLERARRFYGEALALPMVERTAFACVFGAPNATLRVRASLPAASTRIRQLEAQVGVPLVNRSPRGSSLTEAGALHPLEELLGHDLIGVDVGAVEVADGSHNCLYWFHGFLLVRSAGHPAPRLM